MEPLIFDGKQGLFIRRTLSPFLLLHPWCEALCHGALQAFAFIGLRSISSNRLRTSALPPPRHLPPLLPSHYLGELTLLVLVLRDKAFRSTLWSLLLPSVAFLLSVPAAPPHTLATHTHTHKTSASLPPIHLRLRSTWGVRFGKKTKRCMSPKMRKCSGALIRSILLLRICIYSESLAGASGFLSSGCLFMFSSQFDLWPPDVNENFSCMLLLDTWYFLFLGYFFLFWCPFRTSPWCTEMLPCDWLIYY